MITIRKLANKDLPAVYDYIKGEPEINLFIQGDLELYGLQGESVSMYAVGEEWDSILLKYYSDFILYSKSPTFNTKAVGALLARQENILAISAKESLLMQMQGHYPSRRYRVPTCAVATRAVSFPELNHPGMSGNSQRRMLLPL